MRSVGQLQRNQLFFRYHLSVEVIRGNTANEARLDVSAVGFWRPQEKMFADVRILDPNCQSYKDREPHLIYSQHEAQKKHEYNERVLNVEHGTLTALIFSTTGGWGKEVTRFHKQLVKLLSEKRGKTYNVVMNLIIKRLRFTLLRTILLGSGDGPFSNVHTVFNEHCRSLGL